MIKLLTIIGARPQIIKAAALSRKIKSDYQTELSEIILHTGQHYDDNMSQVFFSELEIPSPDYNLNTGSGLHGKQTALMINGIEEVLLKEKPDMVVVYGDTNSTLAASVAASKLNIPIAHVEAGLRSFNKSMPEEINRIVCDHLSTLLFSPTKTGVKNLVREGFKPDTEKPYSADNPKVFHCGDIMYDNTKYFSTMAEKKSDIMQKLNLQKDKFLLATIHRDNNTDISLRLKSIFNALSEISKISESKVIIPIHPRTLNKINSTENSEIKQIIDNNDNIICIPPASFFDMLILEKNSAMIITDSGGVQKESYFFNKPCIILRPQTEWVEIVDQGAAIIADADYDKIIQAYYTLNKAEKTVFPCIFGEGDAAGFICKQIIETFKN